MCKTIPTGPVKRRDGVQCAQEGNYISSFFIISEKRRKKKQTPKHTHTHTHTPVSFFTRLQGGRRIPGGYLKETEQNKTNKHTFRTPRGKEPSDVTLAHQERPSYYLSWLCFCFLFSLLTFSYRCGDSHDAIIFLTLEQGISRNIYV